MSKAAELAALIGSQSALSNRNLIINGAMQVAQRGTSSTITASGVFTSDRFKITKGNTDELVATLTQDTSAPSGFSNSTKITVNTAETAVAADESLNCRYEIEARDLQGIANGTSNAKSLTLSFWVKSSVTGTYTVALYKNDNTSRLITSTYTISTANTWEQKTFTFAGDTSGGGINNDSGSGLSIVWWLTVGSNKTGTNSTSWINYVEGGYAYGHTADIASTASATWQITGVQLEVGEQATPFEHRSYGDELAKCQRYYYEYSGANSDWLGLGNVYQTDQVICPVYSPTVMRALPTLTKTLDGSSQWLSTYDGFTGTDSNASTSLNTKGTSTIASSYIYITGTGRSGSDGQCHWLIIKAGAALHFDAEL